METEKIIAALDDEITTLQKVKVLLSSDQPKTPATSFAYGVNQSMRKRTLSEEARAKIAAAQRKRWAKQRATNKTAAK